MPKKTRIKFIQSIVLDENDVVTVGEIRTLDADRAEHLIADELAETYTNDVETMDERERALDERERDLDAREGKLAKATKPPVSPKGKPAPPESGVIEAEGKAVAEGAAAQVDTPTDAPAAPAALEITA